MTASARAALAVALVVLSLVGFLVEGQVTNSATFSQQSQHAVYEGKMIDAHAHPQGSSDWMIRTLEVYHKAGIDRVIFFDDYDVLNAYKSRPNEIVPSLYVRYMNRTSTVKDVETALSRGFMWIGEALLRHWGETNTPADDPVALQIYDLCAKHRVPITIHQDSAGYSGAYEEMERALEHAPDCVFVFHGWWMGGGHLNLREMERLILAHPNLYVELAGELEWSPGPPWTEQDFLGGTDRDLFAYPDGTIKETWRQLFEKYPSRFINGFDFFTPSAYKLENLKLHVDYWRKLLGQIDQDAAEKIAYRNVEDLLQHRIPSELSIDVRVGDWPYIISVTGTIGPVVRNANISVYYIDPTGIRVEHEVKAEDGVFRDSNAPNLTGDWLVQAHWNGNTELLGCESPMVRTRVLTGGIVIDGYSDDWKQLQLAPLVSDARGDSIGGVTGTDIESVYAALDDKYLYLMFETYDKVDTQVRVQYCFGIDVDGDGKWNYQPGFDAYGYTWFWNLTRGRDYSDMKNLSTLEGTEVGVQEVIEFKMPLAAIKSPQMMSIAPYFVIEQTAGKYVTADDTPPFEVSRPKDQLPPPILAVTSVTHTAIVTSATTPETSTVAVTETGMVAPQSVGLSMTEILMIAGTALILVFAIGTFYLRRRRK
jgi:predicted TIM-barrel fold metal-dependent hydrolase